MHKQLPLEYPKKNGERLPEKDRAKVRTLHQEYMSRRMQVISTADSLLKKCEDVYNDALEKIQEESLVDKIKKVLT